MTWTAHPFASTLNGPLLDKRSARELLHASILEKQLGHVSRQPAKLNTEPKTGSKSLLRSAYGSGESFG